MSASIYLFIYFFAITMPDHCAVLGELIQDCKWVQIPAISSTMGMGRYGCLLEKERSKHPSFSGSCTMFNSKKFSGKKVSFRYLCNSACPKCCLPVQILIPNTSQLLSSKKFIYSCLPRYKWHQNINCSCNIFPISLNFI